MNEHVLDAMIYAWLVMKEKEENKMEGIYVGKVTRSKVDKNSADLLFIDHRQDIHHLNDIIKFDDTAYCLVPSNDIIINNDELLKLRDQVAKLEAELTEIKTTRTLREAYIAGVEKGCESLREERDKWKRRFNSVVTDFTKTLSADGIEFKLKEIDGEGNWDVVIDIPKLNEAEAKVSELEKKLAAAKSNETFWRDRKEEEEDYHHYWLHTFDRVVKQAAEKGIHIGVYGNDEECNAGLVVVDNVKAEDLEKAFNGVRSERDSLDIQNGSLKEVIYRLKNGAKRLEKDNDTKAKAVVEATDRGDHWKRNYEELTEYWDNTYKDIVAAGKKVGVKIDLEGRKPDGNTGTVYVTNVAALELMVKVSDKKHEYNKKWQAMLDALKAKGVEVIYMGEEDEKPCVDVKIPEIDILKKELEALKSRTLDNVEIRLSCGDIVWTYCDGFVHVSSGISGIISADEISTGTVPKCKSCTHYVSGSRSRDIWCRKPVSKKGPGTVRRLSAEEAEGPACSDFKARKE